jgi:hypothetical protein
VGLIQAGVFDFVVGLSMKNALFSSHKQSAAGPSPPRTVDLLYTVFARWAGTYDPWGRHLQPL